jgi:hypothetical protein
MILLRLQNTLRGYPERTSYIASYIDCGSGFQPRSFNFAAGSRSHRGFFMVTWTLWISTKNYFGNLSYYNNSIAFKPLMQWMSLRATAGSVAI